MTNPDSRDELRQELLEHLYGCHDDPARIEALLAQDAEARALLEEVRGLAGLLRDAASETPATVDLTAPPAGPVRRWFRVVRPWQAIAAGFLILFVFAPRGYTWWCRARVQQLESDSLHVLVAGPSRIPAAVPARYRVEVRDLAGAPRVADVAWRALDAEGAVVQQGTAACDGALDFDVDARPGGVKRLEVLARADGFERRLDLDVQPEPEAPLAHLSSDKPVYRPGESVMLRAVLLDRGSLNPREGSYRFRVADAKGAAVQSWVATLEDGTQARQWTVPEDAAGGEYTFELRDAPDTFTFESLPFLVQRFQPPRLAKTVTLDRETYAPGQSGAAELHVERTEGGLAVGASVRAALLVDGDEVWTEEVLLDASGDGVFSFEIPSEVRRGEGRFVARVTDGGVVETAVKPFVIPTGAVAVDFYPEGGDLIAGATNRVYVQVRDSLERPTSAEGRVLDDLGHEVARLRTLHQGRGRFEFLVESGRRYRLQLERPSPVEFDLPQARASGVVLHAVEESTRAGAPLHLELNTPHAGPWLTAVYCRGRLVAQDATRAGGRQDVQLALPDDVAGVLRVTVFDADLIPVAERLVHRESGRRIDVAFDLEPTLQPGAHQSVRLTTRDESGRPVAAMVGVSVYDRAVQEQAARPRLGIEDQTWFLADVENPEHLEEFLIEAPEQRTHLDLLLGTEGWRRFAWRDPEQVVEEHGDVGRRLLAREGASQVPTVREQAGDGPALLAAARRDERQTRRFATGWAVFWGAVFLAAGLLTAVVQGLQVLLRGRALVRPAWVAALSVLLLAPLTVLMLKTGTVGPAAEVMIAADGFAAAPAMAPEVHRLRALGYLGGVEEDAPVEELEDLWRAPGDAVMALGEPARPALADLDLLLPDANEIQGDAGLFFHDEGKRGFLAPGLDPDDDGAQAAGARFRPALVQFREFAHTRSAGATPGARRDFAETVYWNAFLRTDERGEARVEFDLSDSVTTWLVHADAHGASRVGQGRTSFESVLPFFLEAKVPVEVSAGDQLRLPVAITSRGGEDTARTAVQVQGPLRLMGDVPETVALTEGRGRLWLPVEVTAGDGAALLGVAGQAGPYRDRLARNLRVVPRGFPHRRSQGGVLRDREVLTLPMPERQVDGTLRVAIKLYPSPLADLLDGLDGLMREPCGCFEQASSANYPNVLALAYLRAATLPEPAIERRGRELLASGYRRLVGYECSERGYEWFGGDPGHEALTAYGLLQFHDMADVFDVDPDMVARTRTWLLARRDGEGGFERNARALDSFGRAPQQVTDAYVTYALAVTGEEPSNLAAELHRLAIRAAESDDAYEVAVAACALHAAGRDDAADAARERLKAMQQDDGRLVGATTSITSSRGQDLAVETTAFAILAWLADADDQAPVEAAVRFLRTCRSGSGTFGATQATVQALKALKEYAEDRRRITNPGTVRVQVNGELVEERSFDGATREPLVFAGIAAHLQPGDNQIELSLTGDNELPFALDVQYFSDQPASDPDCALALRTVLVDQVVEEGRSVALEIEVQNVTEEGLPMGVAVIGLPAGLEVTHEVLDDLRAAGRFDLWELDGRELTLYWRDFAPEAVKQVSVDLIGRIPGVTRGPASRAWLYYTPTAQVWAEPLLVEVLPAR